MDGWQAGLVWVDETQFEDQLIEAMTRPLTGPGSASAPPPLLVSYPPIEWKPAMATEEFLMLRMTNGEGSIIYLGMLRDGNGFAARSGYRWTKCDFDEDDFMTHVAVSEDAGYHLDYGPVSFPVIDVVAESIRHGRFTATDVILLEAFHTAGAPNI